MGNKRKAPHHSGPHKRIARHVCAVAAANPSTKCWRCGNTLDKCGPRHDGKNKNGTPCTWTAGHVVDGDSRYGYLAECSHCNMREGGKLGYAKQRQTEPHSEWW